MKTHTFQKGDRVECLGVKGVYERSISQDHLFLRDDRRVGADNPFWWGVNNRIAHDRDFKVGDSVRYEGVNDYKTDALEDKRGKIASIHGSYARCEGFDEWSPMLENLVKIAAPEPAEPETVTIEHEQWGKVEGVKWVEGTYWWKEGAHYFSSKGWKEVKPKKWVEVPIQVTDNVLTLTQENILYTYGLKKDYRWSGIKIEKLED